MPVRSHTVKCPVMTADALVIVDEETSRIEIRCHYIDKKNGYCKHKKCIHLIV